MIKKALKAIPVPRADVMQIHKIAIEDKDICGVIISQKKKVKTEETLILNVYQVSEKIKRTYLYYLEYFVRGIII